MTQSLDHDDVTEIVHTGRPFRGFRAIGGGMIPAGVHPFCVAPMLDWTDRYCRYFLRLISRRARLYTEMVTTAALLHGDRAQLLDFDPAEHPVALQLGGSEPAALAICARMAEDGGYDEVNLNVGCPSDRVQSGRFGACLMATPELVADCVAAMRNAVQLPVTVKHRIGIDDLDTYEHLTRFVETVAAAGCHIFIVHARKAWLQGLSPRQNREVPPLHYEVVRQLKMDFPGLQIVVNGGIQSVADAQAHLDHVDGVMVGRAAYHDPYLLAAVDRVFFDDPHPIPSRHAVAEAFIPYVERQLAQGARLQTLTRHILGLFQGRLGARAWRRTLAEQAHHPDAGVEVLRAALRKVPTDGVRLIAGPA